MENETCRAGICEEAAFRADLETYDAGVSGGNDGGTMSRLAWGSMFRCFRVFSGFCLAKQDKVAVPYVLNELDCVYPDQCIDVPNSGRFVSPSTGGNRIFVLVSR